MSTQPFDSQTNFLDPKTTSKGEPYGPIRFKQLVRECYLISKNCNTSYTDILNITPTEKDLILQFLLEEAEQAEKAVNDIRNNSKNF